MTQDTAPDPRVNALVAADLAALHRRTDRLFAGLLACEWVALVALAAVLTPFTWNGAERAVHPNVWAALALGFAIVAPPVVLAVRRPGWAGTRHAVGAAQMLVAALLIHVTGGRIESHFHIFGSLAFLAFYRDWRVLVTASAVTAADHVFRGVLWPETVYGTADGAAWRWAEHAGWVVFEDVFLVVACWLGVRDARRGAERQAALERSNATVEERVAARTRELWESQEQFRSAFDDSAVGKALLAPDGRFLQVNRPLCEMVGYEPAELIARTFGEITHPDDRAADAAFVAKMHAGETRTYQREKRYVRKDGSLVWVRVNVSLVRTRDGEPHHVVSEILDVTEQRQAAEALARAKDAAETTSRIKSEFLANMSHEIRTPMNGILGMTDLLLESDLTREQRESLGLVKSSAESLLGVINDILDFSKIEAGKLDLDPAPLFLRDVIADTLRTLAFGAHDKGLELACDLAPDLPDLVVGDPVRVRQVLVNLIGNAVKFTAKGEVVVRGTLVEAKETGYRVKLSVTDTGIGIPAGKLTSIFDPFTQADGSTTRRFGGSGLGLTICARLVQLMGGRIWVESEIGRGSTFHVEIGLDKPRASAERSVAQPVDLNDVPILVVDDNATNRRVLADTVRSWGARPTCAESGPVGLAELRAAAGTPGAFRVVLLDAMMPDMDGFRVAEEVARDPALASTALLMLTSADRAGDAARCRELGLAAYLVKPVKGADLNLAIALALHPRAPAPSAARVVRADVGTDTPPPVARALRVLVAEDNVVNQRVIVRLLQKYGHTVRLANHGGEALAELDRGHFDLVLMDVQMPEVDGFAATRAIREREAGTGFRQPVVAMTAHAMKGDRERCLAGGMDDYLAKPIQRPELLRVLDWAATLRGDDPGASTAALERAAAAAVPAANDLDRAGALDRLGGDDALYAELVGLFRADMPPLLETLRRAAAGGDAPALNRAAHTLKGAAGYVGGTAVAAAAGDLEKVAAAADLAAVPAALAALDAAAARLAAALADSPALVTS